VASKKVTAKVAWWQDEPLLIYETNVNTMPGCSAGSEWQDRFDPSGEVEHIRASHALQTHLLSVVEAHLTNQFCSFKSAKFKRQGRDYLADYLLKSRKAGYRTIIYFNVHAIRPAFGAEFPDWKQVNFDGTTVEGLYGQETSFCVNSPWRDWVRDVCLDLCKYPIDGIFFDGPCLYGCYCQYCRELYRKQFGRDIPPKQPGHPELKDLADFQAHSLREFIRHSNQAIKAIRPDVMLYCNSGPREEPYYAVGRNNRITIADQDVLAAEGGFVGGDFRCAVWRVGSNAKYYQTQAHGKPTLVFNSPAQSPWRSYYHTEPELRLALAQPPIHGSGVWFSDFLWFHDQPVFRKLAEDYKFFSDNRRFYFKTASLARVAIVWPEDSLNFYSKPRVMKTDFTQAGQKGEAVGDINQEFDGLYDALVKNHFPCDILDEQSVRGEDISKYALLILPNVACTGKVFDDRLRDYVRGGGNVVATFETSVCDEVGRRADRLGLEDLFGVRLLRSPVRPYPHFYFFSDPQRTEVFADIAPALLPAPAVSAEVALAGAELVSPFSVKLTGWSGEEIVPSEFPAVTVNRYGEGKAVYLAATFGGSYCTHRPMDTRLLLRNLCRWLGRRDVELPDAPTSVEVTHRAGDDFETVSLINYSGPSSRPIESVYVLEKIVIRVRTSRTQARALRCGRKLQTAREGQWLVVRLPKLDIFETIVLE
jgi:hypothetical protein